MSKQMIIIAVAAGLVFAPAPAAQAELTGPGGVIAPTGINPDTGLDWAVGDKYHLAFVTTTMRNATATDIGVYDAFVNAAADSSVLVGVPDVDWVVIGATESVEARDHALISAPVYLLDGSKLADGFDHMWNTHRDIWPPDPGPPTNLYQNLNVDENGVMHGTPNGFDDPQNVWTGTGSDGLLPPGPGGSPGNPLGATSNINHGRRHENNANWAEAWLTNPTNQYPFYALSVELDIIGGADPVPGDTNGDRIVNDTDLANFEAQFGGAPGAESADFDGDGDVDAHDFATMRGNWRFGVGGGPLGGAATPEPATITVLALGGLLVLRRRSRKA